MSWKQAPKETRKTNGHFGWVGGPAVTLNIWASELLVFSDIDDRSVSLSKCWFEGFMAAWLGQLDAIEIMLHQASERPGSRFDFLRKRFLKLAAFSCQI